ncbi:hypothetical protein C5F47_00275 [Nitrosopumilus cobalaminigenes]|uniref:Glycosyltransferase RgtA/B/C/D-like domain-containing protein n=1 Tax=Nitrosopumilus cobalaminigenes TaxID=1470066 RepID=A0A7D5LZG0_9ARCH|nr:hypothetical protein C5F47_00275 [Nitrosopumilus cobalaminigenes]
MQSHQIISKFIFITCITVSLVSFVPMIFPFLIIESTIDIPHDDIELFELGNSGLMLIISNIVFISFLILYKLKKLPISIYKIIDLIIRKDVSQKISLLIITSLIFFYVIFSIDELSREEFELGDYSAVKLGLDQNELTDYLFNSEGLSISTTIRFTLLELSISIFDNVRVLPFIASIGLLLVTYAITLELTKKRISAIIAVGILLQSNLFLIFDTTATYENFWTVFYFLSFYLVFKKTIGSHLSFILSMLSKPLAIVFLPINLFAIYKRDSSKFDKKILIISYSALIILILIAFLLNLIPSAQNLVFDEQKFVLGFNELNGALRFDGLILLLFFPTLIILATKKGIITKNIEILFVGIIVMLISQPILYYVTGITVMPYRYIPLVVFMAIGVGMIFTNSKNNQVD